MTAVAEPVRGEVVHTLTENEERIGRGLASFVDVGQALSEIRNQRQYREAGFETFEDYCKQRWDMTASRLYQQMDAARISTMVEKRGLPAPPTERASRPLVRLLNEQGEDAAVRVWEQIVSQREDDRPITGREVSLFLRHGVNANYSGKPGWFELLGEVGDTLIRADKQLAKVEGELRRKPNKAFRDKAGEYAGWAEELAERLRQIETAA